MTRRRRTFISLSVLLACALTLFLLIRVWPLLMMVLTERGSEMSLHCWIKIVDQSGRGISGYKCQIVEDYKPIWPFSSQKSRIRMMETGADGEYEYKSKGAASFVVFGFWDSQWKLNPDHLMQRGHFGIVPREHEEAMRRDPNGFLGSKNNPYLIHVFSIGPARQLLYWECQMNLKDRRNYACVNILSGKMWESKEPEGDIAMKDNPFTDEYVNQQCGHTFYAGQSCSIYPVVDDWGLEPPKNDYKKQLCSSRDWQVLRKYAGGRLAIYFRLNNSVTGNNLYGRLLVDGSGRINDGKLKCYTNLQGERNLFYKGYTDLYDQKIQGYISPPVTLSLEKPTEAKPSEMK